DNDVVVSDPTVSRQHAQVAWGPDGWVFEGQGRAGTFLGGSTVTRLVVREAVELSLASPQGPALRLQPVSRAPPAAPAPRAPRPRGRGGGARGRPPPRGGRAGAARDRPPLPPGQSPAPPPPRVQSPVAGQPLQGPAPVQGPPGAPEPAAWGPAVPAAGQAPA